MTPCLQAFLAVSPRAFPCRQTSCSLSAGLRAGPQVLSPAGLQVRWLEPTSPPRPVYCVGVGPSSGARALLLSSGQLVGGASELDLLLNDNYMNGYQQDT